MDYFIGNDETVLLSLSYAGYTLSQDLPETVFGEGTTDEEFAKILRHQYYSLILSIVSMEGSDDGKENKKNVNAPKEKSDENDLVTLTIIRDGNAALKAWPKSFFRDGKDSELVEALRDQYSMTIPSEKTLDIRINYD